MHKYINKRRAMSEINVVPYVDVMLVLLVIFMVTAPLLTQGVQVELPNSEAKVIDKQPKEPIVVTVDTNGSMFLNISGTPQKPINSQDLQIKVAAELELTPDRMVLVKGDKKASYGQVVEAMVLLQHVGIEKVGLITNSKETLQSSNA